MDDTPTSTFGDLTKQGMIALPWLPGMEGGAGYDSLMQVVRGNAKADENELEFKSPVEAAQKVFQMTKRIENTTELSNSLSITAEASGGFGAFSASASASYDKSVDINTYSIFFLASIQVLNQEKLLAKTMMLDPRATKLAPDEFRKKFGDYFVSGVVTGGYLWALLQMETDSEETKEDISVALKASYDAGVKAGGSFSTDIKRAMSHKGVKMSFFTDRAGGEGSWAEGEPMSTYEDIEQQMSTYAASVSKAGSPICAILTPYSVLLDYTGDLPVASQALGVIRDSLRQSYLEARQILGSLDYAVDHPEQFPADESGTLHAAQQEVRDIIQKISLLDDALKTSPATKIDIPPLPWDKIPKRLWGGTALAIEPPPDLVLAALAPTFRRARDVALNLPDAQASQDCMQYIDQVDKDVKANLGNAHDFITVLSSSMAAISGGATPADAHSLAANLVSLRDQYAGDYKSVVQDWKAQYAELASGAPGGHIDFLEKGLNPLVWDDTSGRVGGVKFWDELTGVTDTVGILARTLDASSAGDQRYRFSAEAWKRLSEKLHDGMLTG